MLRFWNCWSFPVIQQKNIFVFLSASAAISDCSSQPFHTLDSFFLSQRKRVFLKKEKNWVSRFFIYLLPGVKESMIEKIWQSNQDNGEAKQNKNRGGRETLSWCHVRKTWRELSKERRQKEIKNNVDRITKKKCREYWPFG
jgi:hypothetical protein